MNRVVIAVFAASCALLAACGSQVDGDPAPAHSTERPQASLDDLLLDASAFPSGAEHQRVTVEQLQSANEDIAEAFESADVTPASCVIKQRNLADLLNAAFEHMANTVYLSDEAAYTEIIMAEPVDVEGLAATTTGECATVSVNLEVDGDKVATESRFEQLDLPEGYDSDVAIAYRGDTTTALPSGDESDTVELTGYANVRGLTVGIRITTLGSDADLDADEFSTLFAAAIARVEEAE